MNENVGDELYKSLDEVGKIRLTIERNSNNKLLSDYEKTIHSEMRAATIYLFLLGVSGFAFLILLITWASGVQFPF